MAALKKQKAPRAPVSTKVLDAMVRDRSLWPEQARMWITTAHDYAQQVAGGAATAPVIAMFWIRLCGILDDLDKWFRDPRQRVDAGTVAAFDVMHECAEHARRALGDDMLLYAEYRRHVDAHPFQTGYETLHGDGQERTRHRAKLFGGERSFSLDDVDAAVDRVFARFAVNEPAIAASAASAVAAPLGMMRVHALAHADATRVFRIQIARVIKRRPARASRLDK